MKRKITTLGVVARTLLAVPLILASAMAMPALASASTFVTSYV
jgi:hypothetical protein